MGNGCRDAMISHCKDRGETRETPTYDDSFGGGLGIPIPVCTENLTWGFPSQGAKRIISA
jgi:hypothetical protein